MSDFLDIPTLIAIGVAIVVLVRLRSVLGTRTGHERPPAERLQDRFEKKPTAQKPSAQKPAVDDNVIEMRPKPVPAPAHQDVERQQLKLEAEIERFVPDNTEVADGLRAIAEADPGFLPKPFVEGAKAAYEMIVTAFAQGDRKTLKNLLEKDVYEDFEAAIAEREQLGHSVEFTFVGLPGVAIAEAELDKRTAQITMRFDAEVVSATRDAQGDLIEGDAEQVVNISDEWTFARNVRARDPNWKLVATNQID